MVSSGAHRSTRLPWQVGHRAFLVASSFQHLFFFCPFRSGSIPQLDSQLNLSLDSPLALKEHIGGSAEKSSLSIDSSDMTLPDGMMVIRYISTFFNGFCHDFAASFMQPLPSLGGMLLDQDSLHFNFNEVLH